MQVIDALRDFRSISVTPLFLLEYRKNKHFMTNAFVI